MILFLVAWLCGAVAVAFAFHGFRLLASSWSRPGTLPAGGERGAGSEPVYCSDPTPDFPKADKWALIALGQKAKFK